MRRILLAVFCIQLAGIEMTAQDGENFYDTDQLEISAGSVYSDSADAIQKVKRYDVDLTVGTGFTFSPKNFYGPSWYIVPGLSYQITPRFILSGGAGLEYARFYPLYDSGEQEEFLPMTRAFLYARGTYLLSSRLSVSGIAYKGINDVPRLSKYNPAMNYQYQGAGVGFTYKFTESFSVGFEMRIQQNSMYPGDGLIPPEGYVAVPGF